MDRKMAPRFGSRRALLHSIAAAACAAALLCAPGANAQSADELARRHFESGVAYLHESDYENALRAFEKSYELSKRPEILLNIATVHERRSDLPAAVIALEKYLAEKPNAEDGPTVQVRITNLKKRIEEAHPKSAGQVAAPPATPAEPVVTPAAPPPVAAAPEEPNRLPAYIALTVGGVAAAGAVLSGVFAQSEYNEAEASCGQTKSCTDDELSTGRTLATTSTVLTGVALVGIGLGVTLLVTAQPKSEAPARALMPRVAVGVGPNGGSVLTRFVF
jgi:tetratricopeptide (TPR) repeat protein